MLKEVIIDTIEHSEVDLDSPYYEGDERNDIIFQKGIYSETEAMSIDDAMSTLQRLKEGGATHLYVAVNCDHHSYTFTGVCYNVASEGEGTSSP